MPARPSNHMTSFLTALPLFLPNIRVEWRPKSRPRKRWPVNWDPNSVKTEWDLDMIVRGFQNSRFIWFKALFFYEVWSKCGYRSIRDWTVWLTTIPNLGCCAWSQVAQDLQQWAPPLVMPTRVSRNLSVRGENFAFLTGKIALDLRTRGRVVFSQIVQN